MRYRKWKAALLLTMVFGVCSLLGCSSNNTAVEVAVTTPSPEQTVEVSLAPSNEKNETETIVVSSSEVINGLTGEQKNSLNMLNYLAYITQEILAKKNNRVYIDQVYTSLINDVNPSTVNDFTEAHYDDLLDRLHEFEKLLIKRERLQYLYEQNQAQAMRNAIPNPIGLLSAVSSMNIASLVSSVVYMAIDSVSSYTSGMSAAEQTFLEDSWSLDDDESDTIHSLRKQTFMYMVEVVKGYTLPDELTLTEKNVDKLVEWDEKKTEEASPASRVYFYKTHEYEYEGFGQYWLSRARAHYDNHEYTECLQAIQRYEDLEIGIFRQDYELAKVLPIAIGAASQVYDDAAYIETAEKYANQIISNTEIKKDWALRYFAAQTYIDLCARTQDNSYLKKAYKIALENANELKAEQLKLNNEYELDIIPEEIPKGASDAKKKHIEAFNKQKQIERETEIPPVYEPLKLNLDLLYALANQLGFSDSEIQEMEEVLYVDRKPLFISIPMIERYHGANQERYSISYTGKDIIMPANYLTPNTRMTVILQEAMEKTIYVDDWIITKVERKNKADTTSFLATYHSKTMENYDFKKAKEVIVRIECFGSDDDVVYTNHFKVKNSKEWLEIGRAHV